MTNFLIIVAIIAAIYIFAAIAFYYGSQDWYPLCGCTGEECSHKRSS